MIRLLPYFILVFLPILVYLFGKVKKINLNKFSICLFFIIFIIILSLRSNLIGVDLPNYKYFFDISSKLSFKELIFYFEKGEFLYFIFNKIISFFSNHNFQILLTFCAILSILPILKVYTDKVSNPVLTIALFLVVAPFSMFFSGIRQCIAMGIVVYSFKYVENKKFFNFLFCIFIASLFHRSALFSFVLYFLYHINISKKMCLFLIPIMIFIFIFNQQIFMILLKFISIYDGEIQHTGAYSILILLILFAVYCFVFAKSDKVDKEFAGLRNILLFAIFIQMFASIHATVMRINYYYLLFIPLLIPKIINYVDKKNIKFLNFFHMFLSLFFIVYFFYNGYFGEDILHIFPYMPFWR